MGRIDFEARLTRREAQIAELAAWGAARKEIAYILRISLKTVENTLKKVYTKTGVGKATELCVWWFVKHCGLDPTLNPLRRVLGALTLLTIFLPYALMTVSQQPLRAIRAARTAIHRTARRTADTAPDWILTA